MIDDNVWKFVVDKLNTLQKQHDILISVTDKLSICPESPLLSVQQIVEEALLDTLSLLIEDKTEYLHWYVYECDYGRSPMEAGCDGNMQVIDCTDKLRWAIQIHCDD